MSGSNGVDVRVMLDPRELNDLAEFAARGGIGHGIATTDCVAQSPDQLMYIRGDQLILLRDLGDVLLASCEGVVGWVERDAVDFTPSPDSASSSNTTEAEVPVAASVPITVVVAPSPPHLKSTVALPNAHVSDDGDNRSITHENGPDSTARINVGPRMEDKRISSPFELESPAASPGSEKMNQEFFQNQPPAPATNVDAIHDEDEAYRPSVDIEDASIGQIPKSSTPRDSMMSTTSSEALGGIGGFMMGGGGGDASLESESMEELADDHSPANTSLDTPFNSNPPSATNTHPPSFCSQTHSPPPTSPSGLGLGGGKVPNEETGELREGNSDWDIYGDYARESMYVKRASMAAKRGTKAYSVAGSDDGMGSFTLFRAAMQAQTKENADGQNERPADGKDELDGPESRDPTLSAEVDQEASGEDQDQREPETPKVSGRNTGPDHKSCVSPFAGRSLATQLRLRIQKEREQEPVPNNDDSHSAPTTQPEQAPTTPLSVTAPPLPPRSASRPAPLSVRTPSLGPPAFLITNESATKDTVGSSDPDESHNGEAGNDTVSSDRSEDVLESDQSTIIETPHPPDEVSFRSTSPAEMDDAASLNQKVASEAPALASPIPLDEPRSTENVSSYPSRLKPVRPAASRQASSNSGHVASIDDAEPDISLSTLIPPPPGLSPLDKPPTPQFASPWSPSSPSSPHSIAATRQAVEAARATPEANQRARGLTLVGRMDADLRGSTGPVPITFLIGGPGMPALPSPSLSHDGHSLPPHSPVLGIGLPSTRGRLSPSGGIRAASSPTFMMNSKAEKSSHNDDDSRFPRPPSRSASHPVPAQLPCTPVVIPSIPVPPVPETVPEREGRSRASGSASGADGVPRARSRSISAAIARAVGRGKKKGKERDHPERSNTADASGETGHRQDSEKSKEASRDIPTKKAHPPPALSINTNLSPGQTSSRSSAQTRTQAHESPASARTPIQPSTIPSRPLQTPPPRSPATSSIASPPRSVASGSSALHKTLAATSTESLPLTARSATFSFASRSTKTPKKSNDNTTSGNPLPSPVSHKDYAEETVKADGMDFEIVQPRKAGAGLLSPASAHSALHENEGQGSVLSDSPRGTTRPLMTRSETLKSDISGASSRSLPLPDTDEWGFLKDSSPTPEMFQSRNAPGDHRVAEQKWLGIVSTPLPPQTPSPKKVRKLAVEGGIPASLRGRVWAWFLSGTMSARRPGLYTQLLEHEKRGDVEGRIDRDVASVYTDHSIFASPTSPGTSDLRSLLRAYSNFAPSGYHPELALIAGMLLIHCVVEDAFWLLNGLVGNVMNEYFTEGQTGLKVDAAVFGGVLAGSEAKLSRKFKELGIHPLSFLSKWYKQLFLRCLPWPTSLRVIDGVVAEGPRFLLIASLSILTLSRERILQFDTKDQVLGYLLDLPQDALLLPETFMKACGEVRFRDEDWKRLRGAVEREMGLVPVTAEGR